MGEGVKLYRHFEQELLKIGKLKRAWFTTFNLDISFFEKYILTAVLGSSYLNLKIPQDYETLNESLANDLTDLDGEKVEVKVFYDFRALMHTGRPKQTTLPIYAVDVKELRSKNKLRFNEGVFHPKVCVFESYKGEFWLLVSSANLTFGGWSKNRESFFLEKITNSEVAMEVSEFFKAVSAPFSELKNNQLFKELNNKKNFSEETSYWEFSSSFSDKKFLQHILPHNTTHFLRTWSPYFAKDLDLLLKVHFSGVDQLEIIPDKNINNKIRITHEAYKACLEMESLSFKQEKLHPSALESLVHAKVWLTNSILAIGSWNMTQSGMNVSDKRNNNVEAGVIIQLNEDDFAKVKQQANVSDLIAPEHYKEEELENEKEGLLNSFTLTAYVLINWDKLTIELTHPTYESLIENSSLNSTICLPGLGKVSIQQLKNGISFRQSTKSFLMDRYFEIENDGKVLFSGYLRESGLSNRPTHRFETLDDYLKGWVLERPEDKKELHRLNFNQEEDIKGQELFVNSQQILGGTGQNAWFTSFFAFECIANRIKETISLPDKERNKQLKLIGRVLPGSLTELKGHLSNLSELYLEDPKNFAKSPIYLWFLIEKANQLITNFNSLIEIENEQIANIHNLPWDEILPKDLIAQIGSEKLHNWKDYLIKKMMPSK
jgi:hypothetical protein